MSKTERPGDQLLKEVKQSAKQTKKDNKKSNQKETNTMKINQSIKTAATVILTLASLIAVGGIFYAGFTYGQKYESGLNNHIQSQVQARVLSAGVKAAPSK